MYLIPVIGHTGQGKSTWVREFIKEKRQYVFDVNNEYKDLPLDHTISQAMRNTDLDKKRFIKNCSMVRNTNCVFEDATGFLRGKIEDDFAKLLAAKRHTGNNYILLFHSINRLPPEIMEMANYLILFKTVDNVDVVKKKFRNETLTSKFLTLQKMKQHSFFEIKLI